MRLPALSLAAVLVASAAHAQDAGAAAVLAANRAATHGEAFAGKGAAELRYGYAGQGMSGWVASTYDLATGAFVDSNEIGPTRGGSGFDGREAWMQDMSGAFTPQAGGDTGQLAINEAYRAANLWWRPGHGGAAIRPLGARTAEGQGYDVLSVTPRGGRAFEAWFDAKSHLLARVVEPQGWQTITTLLSDYRPAQGVLVAGKIVVDDGLGEANRQTQTLQQARFVAARPLSAYAMPRTRMTDGAIQNSAGRTTVPFQLINNHIYAEVKVNGKGPFRFIFDTGGHDLLTPETARALSVASEGQAAGTGAGEATVDVAFAKGVTFQIGDLVLKDQTITVLPFEASQVEGFPEQGMIGFEVFRRFVTEIDYGAKTLTFIDPARFDPAGAGVAVPFVLYSHLPQVKGAFEGLPGVFDIDTGSRVEVTLTKPFVDANGLKAAHPKGVTAVDGWGVGGRSISYLTRGRSLFLGPVRIAGVVAGLATQARGSFADPNYQGNVGGGVLKRFSVTFDYDRQVMYLRPLADPGPDVGTFDRAGFWINTSPRGFKIVDLTAGGAAEAAGLKVGEEITAVDGAPAGSIAISDMRARLRTRAAGSRVVLAVEGASGARQVALTLKDQI
jgi:hypothetical protein